MIDYQKYIKVTAIEKANYSLYINKPDNPVHRPIANALLVEMLRRGKYGHRLISTIDIGYNYRTRVIFKNGTHINMIITYRNLNFSIWRV